MAANNREELVDKPENPYEQLNYGNNKKNIQMWLWTQQ